MKSQFSGADIPGMGAMNDPLNFIKSLWGGMQVPGMVTPTVSLEELDKKIQDLKTVEGWLNVNMNMLKGSIQALEVQRATIATLQSMSENFAQQMAAATDAVNAHTKADTKPAASTAAGSSANSVWPMSGSATPASTSDNATKSSYSAPTADQFSAFRPAEVKTDSTVKPVESKSEPAAREPDVPLADAKNQPAANNPALTPAMTPFVNPAAMWGLLQDQFKQALSSAIEQNPVLENRHPVKPPVPATAEKTADVPTTAPVRKARVKAEPKTGAPAKSQVSADLSNKPAAKTSTRKIAKAAELPPVVEKEKVRRTRVAKSTS